MRISKRGNEFFEDKINAFAPEFSVDLGGVFKKLRKLDS